MRILWVLIILILPTISSAISVCWYQNGRTVCDNFYTDSNESEDVPTYKKLCETHIVGKHLIAGRECPEDEVIVGGKDLSHFYCAKVETVCE